jgi:hypothetical protein
MLGGAAAVTSAAGLERAEVAAYRDFWRAAPAEVARPWGIAGLDLGGAHCRACGAVPEARVLNHVVGLGQERPATGDDVDAIARFYAGVGTPHAIAVAPGEHSDGLRDLLEARGYAEDYGWMKFARDASEPPEAATDLRIVEAEGELAIAFGVIVATAFAMPDDFSRWCAAVPGRPGWTCYVALAGDEPAGAAALHAVADQAWLGFGGTVPDHRGRGAQSALLARRIRRAAELGCASLVVETGMPVDGRPGKSYRNILRAGFVEAYPRPNWRAPTGDVC